ncbi:type II toxin-antitoxin system RelE/ParE family toxin [candidate division KSB1 bacterium]|nr:type II toxin-antitoxin system RelE/ParE family toxin [candidate division KSB1 bacterium]
MKIIWSPLAITRIDEIADYISSDSPQAARKWVDDIFQKVERLEDFPSSGRVVPELDRKDIREIFYGHYRIIYRTTSDEISILTIRHQKQLLPITEIKNK